MKQQSEGENANNLIDPATRAIDELRNIQRFLLQSSTHPDWPAMVSDMPPDLRALLNNVEQADQFQMQASDRRYEAEKRVRQIKAEIEIAEHKGVDAGSVSRLRELLSQAKTALAAAEAVVDSAVGGWHEAGRALSDGTNFTRMAAYEQEKKKAWLSAHCEVLSRRHAELDRAIGGQRHHLDRLPDRLGTLYDDRIKANSATLLLLRLVVLVCEDPHTNLLGLDLEQLQMDVTHELATLATIRLADDPGAARAIKVRAADRVFAVVSRLIKLRSFGASQAEVAKLANCSTRELRRGQGKLLWQSYINAAAQPRDMEQPKVAQSRQQRLVAEKLRQERLGRDD